MTEIASTEQAAHIPFEHLGLTDAVEQEYSQLRERYEGEKRSCMLGRVISVDRGFPLVCTPDESMRAELSATIKKSDEGIVAIGDWVVVSQPDSHEKAIIEQVLERRTEIARVKRVGRERQPRRQVLAANVDRVFACQSLTGDGLDLRLLWRQVAAVAGCGACPVVLLTKRDCVPESTTEEVVARTSTAMPDIAVHAISVEDAESVELVRGLCTPNTTSMLLGESGVGKSSLVNALTGTESLDVGAVRESDDKGRHTTVARRMIEVPDGGLIIDAPGLRTLQILDTERSIQALFPDVAEAAESCRFRDCAHENDLGCAVRERIAPERLEAYRYLRASDWRN